MQTNPLSNGGTPNKSLLRIDFFRPKILVDDGHLVFESRSDRNITFKTLGSGFVNVFTDQKLVLLSAGRGRGGSGALAALDDLVNAII